MRQLPIVLALILLLPVRAGATWSIVAVDRATGQVGAAASSCVGGRSILFIYGSVPGRGALVAQAQSNQPARDRGVQLMMAGESPQAIIAAITDPMFDPDFARRQFGVVDLDGRSAGFTGAGTMPFADDRQLTAGDFVFSVQGNILTGTEVLDGAAAAFAGCDLADRLIHALEAGGTGGIGDSRCTPSGAPSDSAFLTVDRRGEPAGSWLRLDTQSAQGTSPLPALRARYDAWRATHACPSADAGFGDAEPSLPDSQPQLFDAIAGADRPAPDASTTPVADAAAAESDAHAVGAEPSGCGCSNGRAGAGDILAIAALFLLVRRRR